jgi:hypothetical protein
LKAVCRVLSALDLSACIAKTETPYNDVAWRCMIP